MKPLMVAYDALPLGHWGPLFHVLRLEQPAMRLEFRRMGFPSREGSLLQSADVGLFVEPPREAGLSALTIETSQMLVVTAVGHRLARNHDLRVVDILDQPFPGGPTLHPQWLAFWTLDKQRGGPPPLTNDRVENPEEALSVVAAGRAIATIPATIASSLPHPGVIAIPLRDGPPVATRLVWRSDGENPIVHALIELAAAMTGFRRRRHSDGGNIERASGASSSMRSPTSTLAPGVSPPRAGPPLQSRGRTGEGDGGRDQRPAVGRALDP